MNKFIATVQILSTPKVIKNKSNSLMIVIIAIPNSKKEISFFRLQLYIEEFILIKLLHLYVKKDICLVEGNIISHNLNILANTLSSQYKFKKYLSVNLSMIQVYVQKIKKNFELDSIDNLII